MIVKMKVKLIVKMKVKLILIVIVIYKPSAKYKIQKNPLDYLVIQKIR